MRKFVGLLLSLMGLSFGLLTETLAQSTVPEALSAPVMPSVTDTTGSTSTPGSEDAVTIEAKTPEATNSEIEQIYSADREKFLTTLKKEIEPNLIKGDIQKLNRNVMRLGSYRKDWVVASEEFLSANAALAEPYLYRYASLGNVRLNRSILRTLNRMSNLREPRAVLMFLHVFVDDPEENVLALDLLSKVSEQNTQIAAEAVSFLNGPIVRKVSLERRLQLGSKICAKVSASAAKDVLKAWQSAASTFWEKVLADELESCLKSV